jgi:hypothetical protein
VAVRPNRVVVSAVVETPLVRLRLWEQNPRGITA